MRAPVSGNAVAHWLNEDARTFGLWLNLTCIVIVCLLFTACAPAPPRPFFSSRTPVEFIDYVPMEAGVLQQISLHFAYEVEMPAESRPYLIVYHLDFENEQKEPLAAIKIDGIVVNEYSRKSIFAVSWDEKTLLYMHDQTSPGPESLQNKPSGLYEYVIGRGDRLIYSQAAVISHSTFQLARNAIEFALGDPNDPTTEHYVRSTEGVEFTQEEAFVFQYGGTGLHRAAAKGDLARAQELLEYGLDLEARDNRGFTPLHAAIWAKHEEMAKLLIEQGADVNARIFGALDWSPIEEAARFGLVDTIGLLLEHGANIDSRNIENTTPLHLAISYNKFWTAEMLVANGAEINIKTIDGTTPLHFFSKELRDERSASWNGGQEETLLNLLLEKGAHVNAQDNVAATPLHYAVLKNNIRTAQILVQNGADATAMELADSHYYGSQFHHKGSKLTLEQRINETLESAWWKQSMVEK